MKNFLRGILAGVITMAVILMIPALVLAVPPLPVSGGGTNTSSFSSGALLWGNGTSTIGTAATLFWSNSTGRLNIGTSTNQTKSLNVYNSALPSIGLFSPSYSAIYQLSESSASLQAGTISNVPFNFYTNNGFRGAITNGGQWTLGSAADATKYTGARAIVTSGGNVNTNASGIGLVGERIGGGYGVYGFGQVSGGSQGVGVAGLGSTTDSSSVAGTYGVQGFSNDTHSGGPNYGGYFNGSGSTYESIGVFGFGDSPAQTGSFITIGAGGNGRTNGGNNATGVHGKGTVTDSADTGVAYGGFFQSTQTHAGANNIGVYSTASGGATSYSFYGASGQLFNADATTLSTLNMTSATSTNMNSTNYTGTNITITNATTTNLNVSGQTTIGSSNTGLLYGNSGVVGARTLQGTASQVSVSNGTGTGGDPTISLPSSIGGMANLYVTGGGSWILPVALEGSSNTQTSLATYNSTLGALNAGNSYARVFVAGGGVTEGTSGNHPLLASMAIAPVSVTAGVATVSNTASFYIAGPMSATVSGGNYAIWSKSGPNKFGDDVYVASSTKGMILTSPDGTCYRFTVANGGTLSAGASVTCP